MKKYRHLREQGRGRGCADFFLPCCLPHLPAREPLHHKACLKFWKNIFTEKLCFNQFSCLFLFLRSQSMVIETKRLILRPFLERDAVDVYE